MHVHSQRADVHVSGVCWCELARDGPGGCVYRSTVSCQKSQIAKPPVPMWTLVTHTHTHTLQALPHPASCPRCKNSNHALILGRLLLSFPFFNCPFLPSSFPLSLFGTEVTLVRTCVPLVARWSLSLLPSKQIPHISPVFCFISPCWSGWEKHIFSFLLTN